MTRSISSSRYRRIKSFRDRLANHRAQATNSGKFLQYALRPPILISSLTTTLQCSVCKVFGIFEGVIANVMRERPFIARPPSLSTRAKERLPSVIVAFVALMGTAFLFLHPLPRLPLSSLALRLLPALDLEIPRQPLGCG